MLGRPSIREHRCLPHFSGCTAFRSTGDIRFGFGPAKITAAPGTPTAPAARSASERQRSPQEAIHPAIDTGRVELRCACRDRRIEPLRNQRRVFGRADQLLGSPTS